MSQNGRIDALDDYSQKILEIYSRELDRDERVHHALEEAAKHPPKLAKLYEKGEKEHLKEEVVDILLLAHVLKQELGVDNNDVESAGEHFVSKIDSIYD